MICFWNYRLQNVGLLKCLKKTRVRTLMESQHVKGSEWVLKSARQYFCHIFLSLWKKISTKISLLVGAEIFRLVGNILTPDEEFSLSVKGSVQRHQFKLNSLKIKSRSLWFLLHFLIPHKIWNTLKKIWASEVISFWNYPLKIWGF